MESVRLVPGAEWDSLFDNLLPFTPGHILVSLHFSALLAVKYMAVCSNQWTVGGDFTCHLQGRSTKTFYIIPSPFPVGRLDVGTQGKVAATNSRSFVSLGP